MFLHRTDNGWKWLTRRKKNRYVTQEIMHKWYAEQADTVEKFLKGEELPDMMT